MPISSRIGMNPPSFYRAHPHFVQDGYHTDAGSVALDDRMLF